MPANFQPDDHYPPKGNPLQHHIQAHAPTTDYSDEVIKDFYEQLQEVIDQTPKKDILTRSFLGADIGSDHELVLMTFKLHRKKANKLGHTRIKFDLERLKDPEEAEAFQATISGKFAALTILDAVDTDIDTLIGTFNTVSLIITLSKKGSLQLCENYRTIGLISHPSKVMLKILLNRLKSQAEKIIAEEQTGFRQGHSTTEQIFNLRILCERYLQHQQDLYHVFVDFKKAFDRISAEKTKLMTNNTNGISNDIKVCGEKLETVNSFKFLGANITDAGSKPEILARIAQTTAALTNLKKDTNIALSSKIRLMRALVMSIFLYACHGISYKDRSTNEEVRNKIRQVIGPHEELLTTVKRRKLKWYGHVSRSSGLSKTVLQGSVIGGRRRGRQKERWDDKVSEWTGMRLSEALRQSERREEWRELVARSSVVPQRSSRLRDK
ncbi:uncharacterized protein LOC127869998 [Dreissena polymorpha]|uniref:uncharacterized protein LOC127869998 n=1 Tax=Dreissena polymorpha TaxID=45954 RepID=UPI0022649929|nr:uncharacterized protein LOC127869998 [Dreissena polymorpha]